jgi:vacuolar-type H+-ATPase subunit D/Vma8
MADFEKLVQQKLLKHKKDPMFGKARQLVAKAFEWQKEGGKKAIEAYIKKMVAEITATAEQQLKDIKNVIEEV